MVLRQRLHIAWLLFFVANNVLASLPEQVLRVKIDEFALNSQSFSDAGQALFAGAGKGIGDDFVKNIATGFESSASSFGRGTSALTSNALSGIGKGLTEAAPILQEGIGRMGKAAFQFPKELGLSYNNIMKFKLSFFAIQAAYASLPVVFWYIQRQLAKPRVIINTNMGLKNRLARLIWKPKIQQLIWSQALQDRLEGFVAATKNVCQSIRNKKGGIYRNLLMYGPPGTGKTSFARQLAERSGMNFVEVTGSSFFQEGAGEGAIDELFSWAKKKGNLMIFIDEFDSFASNRDALREKDQKSVRIINHLLNYIGTESDRFMIVVATNNVLSLDEAIDRRFPDKVEIGLPDAEMRLKVLQQYKGRMIDQCKNNKPFVESVERVLNDVGLQNIANQTEGLSNGHLMYLVDDIKSRASTKHDGLVTKELVAQVVADQIKFHKMREEQKVQKEVRLQHA